MFRTILAGGFALTLGLVAPLGAQAADTKDAKDPALPLRLSAFAINMGLGPRMSAGMVDIVIERWSTEDETNRLVETLSSRGSGALLSAVQSVKPRAGYIRTPYSVGWDIAFAREEALPNGGRRVIFATDRPMSFGERYSAGRSTTYEFMVGEVHFEAAGRGQGSLIAAAKLRLKKDKKTLEIENLDSLPVRLNEVAVLTEPGCKN